MKKRNRFLAIILAAAVCGYGLPVSPSAKASDEIENLPAPKPTTAMKFVQAEENGFDPETGILTMSLMIRPTEGQTVSEGMFAFQTDIDTVVPVTSPDSPGGVKSILAPSGRLAVIGSPSNSSVIQAVLEGDDPRGILTGTSFNVMMHAYNYYNKGDFQEKYTGFLVSAERSMETNKLDCYFQYRFDLLNACPTPDAEGYVKISDFYFQCYSGYENGSPKKATGEEALFTQSITVPQSEEEAQALTKQFYSVRGDVNSAPLAMGAAGYIEKSFIGDLGSSFYYFGLPVTTEWRKNGKDIWDESSQKLTDAEGPGYWYPHMLDPYIVKEFLADYTNTYGTEGDVDFFLPDQEKNYRCPRYLIPTEAQSAANDEQASWIPVAYNDPADRRMMLKYYLGTIVTDNAETSPEVEDFDRFLENIQWEFVLVEGKVPLSSLDCEETGKTERVPTPSGDLIVKEAVISSSNGTYCDGYKVQKVYRMVSGIEEYWMTTPLGVTLDFVESEITYMDTSSIVTLGPDEPTPPEEENTGEVTKSGLAPQLHITNEAADSQSFLWKKTPREEQGQILLQATYTANEASFPASVLLETRVYKDESRPTRAALDTAPEITSVTGPNGGEQVPGFAIGVPVNSGEHFTKDRLAAGITIHSALYDQYGFPMEGKWNDVTLLPTEETKAALRAAGKSEEPFVVVPIESAGEGNSQAQSINAYTIKYSDGRNVNDAVSGYYELKAQYAGAESAEPVLLYVSKEPDYLDYVSTMLSMGSASEETEPGVLTVDYMVPTLKTDGTLGKSTVKISILELANQWRDPNAVINAKDISKYDIVSGIRSDTDPTLIDLKKLSGKNVEVVFKPSVPEGSTTGYEGINTEQLETEGVFSFTSRTPDEAVMYCEVIVTDPVGTVRSVKYKFVFHREAKRLQKISVENPGSLEVPTQTDSPRTKSLTVTPIDQYGTPWNWPSVEEAYKPGGRLNSSTVAYDPWSAYIDLGKDEEAPAGVSLIEEHKAKLEIVYTARTCIVNVRAKFAGVVSDPVPISINRPKSKPIKITSITYPETVLRPAYVGGGARTFLPKVEVIDQYNEVMDESTYTMGWMFTKPVDSKKVAELNTNTGEITVKECAPNQDLPLRVTVFVDGNATIYRDYNEMKIEREDARVGKIAVETSAVDFPTTEQMVSGGGYFQLEASGNTQYGDSQSLEGDTQLSWSLSAVEFRSGKKLVYAKDDGNGNMVPTGEISYSSSAKEYKAGVVKLNSVTGVLSFTAVTQLGDVPKTITVTAKHSGSVSSKPAEIAVGMEASVFSRIYIQESSYSGGLQVPNAGEKVSISIDAQAKDQYGIPNAGWTSQINWSVPDGLPAGVEQDQAHPNVFTIDNTDGKNKAQYGSFGVTAAYQTQKETINIVVSKDPVEVGAVKVGSLLDASGKEMEGMRVPLPAATGTGDMYTLRQRVEDQYGTVMSGAVTWSIVGTPSGIGAQILDPLSGKLRITYSEDFWGSGKAEISVKATSASDPTKFSDPTVITIYLGESKPAYATPSVIDYGEMHEGLSVIPREGTNTVVYTAKVYDQYRKEMAGEEAVLKLETPGDGFQFGPTENPSEARLTISPKATILTVKVSAAPKKGGTGAAVSDSTHSMNLSRGVSYIDALRLEFETGLNYQVPAWESETTAQVKGDENFFQYRFNASVIDQYGGILDTSSKPVWQLEDDYEGVRFSEGTTTYSENERECAIGEWITLEVSNLAIEKGQLEKTIYVNVWTSNQEKTENFCHRVPLRLVRSAPTVKYMYFENVNESGTLKAPLQRPHVDVGSETYTVMPVVYDQYGIPVEDVEIQMLMDISIAEQQDAIVEKIYKRGESEENGDLPEKYIIYQQQEMLRAAENPAKKIVMAEFDRLNGTLTLYNTCELERLEFTARCSSVGDTGSFKRLIVPIAHEERRAGFVEIVREHVGAYTVQNTSQENMTERVSAVVYDQYGETYLGNLKTLWTLNLRQEDGSLTEYKEEFDEDGQLRMDEEFLVLKKDSLASDRSTRITVQPASFYEEKTVVLKCEVRGVDNSLLGIEKTSDITVKRPSNGGGAASLVLTFHPGEHGKLVGPDTVAVEIGSKPAGVPGIKSDVGFGFIGWTSDGKQICDPSEMIITSDAAYTAVYKDITDTAFLDGYEDNTIRPGKKVTRAEFVKMLMVAAGGYDATADYGSSFRDVSPEMWYSNYIAFAVQQGAAKGYPDHSFRPNHYITRAEAAQMIAQVAQLKGGGGTAFSDIPEGAWYESSVAALSGTGIVSGYEDGTFRPEKNITREEAVKMIVMMTKNALKGLELQNIKEYAYCPFEDVKKGQWAFAYILRAAGIA